MRHDGSGRAFAHPLGTLFAHGTAFPGLGEINR